MLYHVVEIAQTEGKPRFKVILVVSPIHFLRAGIPVYAPPNHRDGVLHHTRADAEADNRELKREILDKISRRTTTMKKIILASGWARLFVDLALGKTAATAKADLTNSKREKVGTAKLKEAPKGMSLSLEVSNLPPGVHGFHIHTVGACDPPDFKSAGGHFNAEGKKHGWENPEGHHAGDLQNLTVDAHGKATVKVVVPGVRLGDGPNSLFHPQGTALVIHADPDDMKTDPAGNAGTRIACGVISK